MQINISIFAIKTQPLNTYYKVGTYICTTFFSITWRAIEKWLRVYKIILPIS